MPSAGEGTAREFTRAWERGDYRAMYRLLDGGLPGSHDHARAGRKEGERRQGGQRAVRQAAAPFG